MAYKKSKPAGPTDYPEGVKSMKFIYSVNGSYRAKLVNINKGGWICEIWSRGVNGGRDRPMLRNVRPFATLDEAIQMARTCFHEYTGDDRYFAEEDILKKNETN